MNKTATATAPEAARPSGRAMFRWSVFAIALAVFMGWVIVQSHREHAEVAGLEQQLRNQQQVASNLGAVRPQVRQYMALKGQFEETIGLVEQLRRNTAQPESVLPVLGKETGAQPPIDSIEFTQDTMMLYDLSKERLDALRGRLATGKELTCYKVLARATHQGFKLECKVAAPAEGAKR